MVRLTDERNVRRKDQHKFDRIMDFSGLSTDEKPIKTFDGFPILNGSTFLEMDTSKVSIYNEDSDSWMELGE